MIRIVLFLLFVFVSCVNNTLYVSDDGTVEMTITDTVGTVDGHGFFYNELNTITTFSVDGTCRLDKLVIDCDTGFTIIPRYDGTFNYDKSKIKGVWVDSGGRHSLNFSRR